MCREYKIWNKYTFKIEQQSILYKDRKQKSNRNNYGGIMQNNELNI